MFSTLQTGQTDQRSTSVDVLKNTNITAVREEIPFSSVFVRQAVVATSRFRISFMNSKRITLPGDVSIRVLMY